MSVDPGLGLEGAEKAFHESLQRAIDQQGLTIPDGHKYALTTNWGGPGTPIEAVFATKINDTWSAGAKVAWHGDTPEIGFQVHGSWG